MATSKREKARELYRNGVPVWRIADILNETLAKVIWWTEDLR